MKVKGRIGMNSKVKSDSVDFLFRSILKLKTVEECYDFFEDLCTVPEIKATEECSAVSLLSLYVLRKSG